jgi:hypothetical protein
MPDRFTTQSPEMEIGNHFLSSEAEGDFPVDEKFSNRGHIYDARPTDETIREIAKWVATQQRENTRTRLAMPLVKGFVYSIGLTFTLIGLVVLTPNADKNTVKELIPLIITPQVTLLGVTLGFYFGAKEE